MNIHSFLRLEHRFWIFVTIGLSLMLAVLAGGMINVALPRLSSDLGVSDAEIVWVLVCYQAAVMVALLPLASLGEIIGYRVVYAYGLVVFTIGSAMAGTAETLTFLLVARAVQGAGAAGILSVNSALVRHVFPAHLLGRGVAFTALCGSFAYAAGPMIASAVLAVADWHLLFLLNIPFGLLMSLTALTLLPRSPLSSYRFDGLSAMLCMSMLGLMVFGLDRVGRTTDWLSSGALLIAAMGIGFALVRRQRSAAVPMLPLDLLRVPPFAYALLTSSLVFAAQGLAFVALPFLFHNVYGMSIVQTGLLMSPWPIALFCAAPVVGALADRYSPAPLTAVGIFIMAVGIVLTVALPVPEAPVLLVGYMAVCGLGFAFFQTPNNRAIILGAPLSRSGGASGLQATTRLFGQTIGTALSGISLHLFREHGAEVALSIAAGFASAALATSLLRSCRGTLSIK